MPLSYGISLTRPVLEGPTSALTPSMPAASAVATGDEQKNRQRRHDPLQGSAKGPNFVNLVTM